ncbi:MAG: sulfatase-like hydrolase/transferase [Acidimicrobiia bacterium]|nr:sulfatase-like hydrolase/transferase [Acidimicrobiia bacterium]
MGGYRAGRTRRQILRTAGAGAAVWGVGQALGTPSWNIIRSRRVLAQNGPDVYVITLDDCSPEYIGYYQSIVPTAYQGPIHTPELDALFADSWTSSSCRATVPVCAASRSSFLAAAPAAATGVFGASGLFPPINQFVARVASGQLVTLPGVLTSLGLDTAVRGKIDHNGALFDLPGQIVENGAYTSIAAMFNDPAYSPDGRPGSDFSFMPYAALPAGVTHVDELRTDEQIARINAPYNGQRVDFLGFVMPHVPRTVAQSWIDLYDLADIQLRTTPAEVAVDQADIPATHLGLLEGPYILGQTRYDFMVANGTEDGLKEHIRHMLATLSHTSFQIGRLRTALDAAGRPYVIVLTADHGYHMAEKGHYAKGTLYDKALLAPLAVYSSDPNPSYPVGDSDKPVSLLGLAKSVAALAGVAPGSVPAQWQGNAFDDPTNYCTEHSWGSDEPTQSRALVFRAVATNTTYKIIVHPGDASELYDLTADPGETDNRLVADGAAAMAQRAEVDRELRQRARRQRAAEWLASGGRPTDPQYV